MSESHLAREDLESADTLLQDLLDGRDRLLTAGEVAELLNINVNTLYLWRASGEVDLPYQRFISPGQTRGVIRYKYSDVVLFLARATKRGAEEAEQEGDPAGEADSELPTEPPAGSRKKNQRRKTKLTEQLRDLPLEEILAHTQDGTNLSVAEHRAKRAAELAPPPDATLVENPGEVIYDSQEQEPETQAPAPTLTPEATKAAADEWLARFAVAFSHPTSEEESP